MPFSGGQGNQSPAPKGPFTHLFGQAVDRSKRRANRTMRDMLSRRSSLNGEPLGCACGSGQLQILRESPVQRRVGLILKGNPLPALRMIK